MRTPPVRLGALITTLALAAAGCDFVHSVAPDHNETDLEFATEMVPHDEQALRLAAIADSPRMSPSVRGLATRVTADLAPAVATMDGWLDSWAGETDDDAGRMGADYYLLRHGAATLGGGRGWPGMMHAADFHRLRTAGPLSFEDTWLRLMTRQVRGAVSMARVEVAHGQYDAAVTMARQVEATQRARIQRLTQLMGP